MSFQRKFWNVRTFVVSIGYLERTANPNCPGKKPNPSASSGPPITPLLLRSNPDGIPVFDGAMNVLGYEIGAAPFWEMDR